MNQDSTRYKTKFTLFCETFCIPKHFRVFFPQSNDGHHFSLLWRMFLRALFVWPGVEWRPGDDGATTDHDLRHLNCCCSWLWLWASWIELQTKVHTKSRPSPGWKRLLLLSHLRHYAKWALTPRSLNVKLGPRRNYHKGRAAIRYYANQPACRLWLLCLHPNFISTYSGVNTHLA